MAAQNQLMLGFWWDSRTFTRTLEERKLLQYVDLLANFASRTTLTLRELQSVAGRMQRCIMTFPPGAACLLVSVFTLMVGLRLPWHARRTTRAARKDFSLVHQLQASKHYHTASKRHMARTDTLGLMSAGRDLGTGVYSTTLPQLNLATTTTTTTITSQI